MKRIGVVAVWVALGLAFGAGCGKAADVEFGGETHWLMSCDTDAECGSKLACLCGVCTLGCSDEGSCSELGTQARCLPPTPSAEGCRAGTPALVCARADALEPNESPELSGPVLAGARYDELNDCFRPAGSLGDSPAGLPCADAETHAVDAQGSCWLFESTCLPEGFTALDALPGNRAYACRETFRFCSEPLACGDQQLDVNGACVTCNDLRASRFASVSSLLEATGWDACSTDADCVMEPVIGSCEWECDRAVGRDYVEDFRSELSEFLPRFCGDLEPAAWAARCSGADRQECGAHALCRAGKCREGTRCADRSIDACASDADCVVSSAAAYDSANSCFAQGLTPLACVDADLSCPPVITPALDAFGNCYAFGNCLPPEFTPAPDDHPCRQAVATPCTP